MEVVPSIPVNFGKQIVLTYIVRCRKKHDDMLEQVWKLHEKNALPVPMLRQVEDADARPPHPKGVSCVGVAQCGCMFLQGIWQTLSRILQDFL